MVWASDLDGDNPWWDDPGSIERDKYILAWEQSRVRRLPAVLDDLALDRDAVYTLRGARQIGKTTAAKLLVRRLLADGVSPYNILFYSCDVAGDSRGLYEIIRAYLSHRDRARAERTFILLDEISSVGKWQLAIKRLWDMGSLRNCTIVAAGSHTVGPAHSAARLPGRRGGLDEAMDKIMRPLSFFEYVASVDGNLAKKIRPAAEGGGGRDGALDAVFSGSISAMLRSLSAELPALNGHLDDYVLSGGIPLVVEKRRGRNAIPEETYAAYLDLVLDDIASFGRKHEAVKGISAALTGSIGRPVSWTSLSKKTGLPSAASAMEYVSLLKEMLMVSIMYQYNAGSKSTMPRSGKKIHFADPFYFHTLHGWAVRTEAYYAGQKFLGDEKNLGHMVEGVVAGHLIRAAFRRSPQKPWFRYSNYLAYWRYGPEREVDFVYNDGHVEIPIEVKFGRSATKRDLDGIIAFKKKTGAKNGLVLTRDALASERECLKVPAPLFLLLA